MSQLVLQSRLDHRVRIDREGEASAVQMFGSRGMSEKPSGSPLDRSYVRQNVGECRATMNCQRTFRWRAVERGRPAEIHAFWQLPTFWRRSLPGRDAVWHKRPRRSFALPAFRFAAWSTGQLHCRGSLTIRQMRTFQQPRAMVSESSKLPDSESRSTSHGTPPFPYADHSEDREFPPLRSDSRGLSFEA